MIRHWNTSWNYLIKRSFGGINMKLKGIAASNGIAIAKVYKLEHLELDIKTDLVENVQVETEKFKKAIETSQKELEIN